MSSQKKSVGILYPVSYLDSVPCVRNLAVLMAQSGIQVELFILEAGPNNNDVDLPLTNLNIYRFPLKTHRGLFSRHLPTLLTFSLWAKQICSKKNVSFLIGVDPHGLAGAAIVGTALRLPWIYHSLELIISTDPIRMYRGYKPLEIWASRRAAFIIIQDEMRAKLMADDNKISLDRFVYLPNSPLGPAFYNKTNILYSEFGFHKHDKILLQAGTIDDAFGSLDLAKVAHHFPTNWKLVFQDRYSDHSCIEYFGDLFNHDTVHISQNVPYDHLVDVVRSADVGIGLYNVPESPNIVYLGKSSGKLSQYLQCGLPIITNRMPGWDNWVSRYHSGLAIDSTDELKNAVSEILDNYENFSKGAIDHFEAELRFEPAFENLLGRLEQLRIW